MTGDLPDRDSTVGVDQRGAREAFPEARHGPPVLSENPARGLFLPHHPDPSGPALVRRAAQVNSLNETLSTSLVHLVLFLAMGIMILWGVWLLDLPG